MSRTRRSSRPGSARSTVDTAATEGAGTNESWTKGWRGLLVLWSGWLLPQFVLMGPALVGWTVFSPVDLLAVSYFPSTAAYENVVPQDQALTDLVQVSPAARQFCAEEFRAGRLPLWQPANFAGAPFATWPKYSLFELPFDILPSPIMLAWMHVLQVLCCGAGMWLFLRRSVRLSFWPAAVGSWCAPLTGFLSLWQGYPTTGPVCWFPWLLFFASNTVSRPWGWSAIGSAIFTALLLYTGQSDVGGLVLLTTGLYVSWMLGLARLQKRAWTAIISGAGSMAVAWLLGFALAAPYLLPLFEYTRTGARMQARAAGREERPPEGIRALPAVVLPEIYGSTRRDSLRLDPANLLESSSGAYAGLVATMWLAPLAWCDRKRRGETVFWTGMACLSLAWALDLPGIVQIQRLPPLNMLSYSRWVFASAMAILILSAIGMERLLTAAVDFRRWFLLPILVTLGLGLWCLVAAVSLPEPLNSQIKVENLDEIRRSFSSHYAFGALLSLIALGGWWATLANVRRAPWQAVALAGILLGELVWFTEHQSRQASPELYFPRVAALEELAKLPPGRIWGIQCLPPNLNQSHGLSDVRGYDAVDPQAFVNLLDLARDTRFESPEYAKTQFAVPLASFANHRLKLSPVANLLNVRYLVFRTAPVRDVPILAHVDDYWIVENPDCLPRMFVPKSALYVHDDEDALRAMARPTFDPAAVVVLTEELDLPKEMKGTVALRAELPTHIELDVEMETDGLVVISDRWDLGWRADVDGQASPIRKVDYALKGVRVPKGRHNVVLTYAPDCLRQGVLIGSASALVVLLWGIGLAATAHFRKGASGKP